MARMYNEDTGEEPKCMFCDSEEGCDHFVACIDRTFNECSSGALYDRDWEFSSEIKTEFLRLLKSGREKKWDDSSIEDLWGEAKANFDAETEDVILEGIYFYRLLIELLEDAGAIDHPGSIVDEGGPGMSSAYTLLFADNPKSVVDDALKNLKKILFEKT
jgi:hypothetical protein